MLSIVVSGKPENVKVFENMTTSDVGGVFILRESVFDKERKDDRLWMVYFKKFQRKYIEKQVERGYNIVVYAINASAIPSDWGEGYDQVVCRLEADRIVSAL